MDEATLIEQAEEALHEARHCQHSRVVTCDCGAPECPHNESCTHLEEAMTYALLAILAHLREGVTQVHVGH